MKNIVLVLSLAFIAFSCKKEETGEIDQNKVYTAYELYYDANLDETVVKVIFRNSSDEGSQLKLSDPATVTFEGTTLNYDENKELYSISFDGKKTSGSFIYSNTESTVYTNAIEVSSIDYPSVIDTIFRNQDYEFTWTGDTISTNESISFNVNDFFSGNVTLFVEDEVGASTITMTTANLLELEATTSECILERTYSPTLADKPNAGGEISARYRAKNTEFVIE